MGEDFETPAEPDYQINNDNNKHIIEPHSAVVACKDVTSQGKNSTLPPCLLKLHLFCSVPVTFPFMQGPSAGWKDGLDEEV